MMSIKFNENGIDKESDCVNIELVKVLRITNLKSNSDLDIDIIKALSSLEELDLSGNNLTEIKFLGIPLLRKLNCSNNLLSTVEFLHQFPDLRELYLDGNPLTLADNCIAAALCPKLKKIDGNSFNFDLEKKLYLTEVNPEVIAICKKNILNREKSKNVSKTALLSAISLGLKNNETYRDSGLQKYFDFEIDCFLSKLIAMTNEEMTAFIQENTADKVSLTVVKNESDIVNCVDFIVKKTIGENTQELITPCKDLNLLKVMKNCDENKPNFVDFAEKGIISVNTKDYINSEDKDLHNLSAEQKNSEYQENSEVTKYEVQPKIDRNFEYQSHLKDSLPLKDAKICLLTNKETSKFSHFSELSSKENKYPSSDSTEDKNSKKTPRIVVSSDYKLRNKSINFKRKSSNSIPKLDLDEISLSPKKRNIITENTLPSSKQWQPTAFLRCHSLNNSPEDDKIQVWRCVFAPDTKTPGHTSHVVATCGGNTVCIVDCSVGKVLQRYKHHNPEEEFFALAWTALPIDGDSNKVMNILAAAGRLREIRLFHIDQLICFNDIKCHSRFISSLAFHPAHSSILCSGSADGTVIVWDIGIPSVPDYKTSCRKLFVIALGSDVLNMAVIPNSDLVIAGCEKSCFGWHLKSKSKTFQRKPDYEFLHPKGELKKESSSLVDSVVMVTASVIASKCAGHGCIYIWDIPSTLNSKKKKTQTKLEINLLAVLKWSDTDNVYMNIGAQFGHGIVSCGDANGQMWIYNISKLLKQKRKAAQADVYLPSDIIPWPDCVGVQDLSEINLKYSEIIMNMLSISSDGKYLVAATNKNLLCIWQ